MTVADSMRAALVVFRSVRRALHYVLAMHGTEVITHINEIFSAIAASRPRGRSRNRRAFNSTRFLRTFGLRTLPIDTVFARGPSEPHPVSRYVQSAALPPVPRRLS